MKVRQTNNQVLNPSDLRNICRKSQSYQAPPAILPWLPLIVACVLETVWAVSPGGTVLSGFSLLACILMAGVSLIVGIIMLIEWKYPLRAMGILLCTIVLPLLLIVLFFEVLHLNLLLH